MLLPLRPASRLERLGVATAKLVAAENAHHTLQDERQKLRRAIVPIDKFKYPVVEVVRLLGLQPVRTPNAQQLTGNRPSSAPTLRCGKFGPRVPNAGPWVVAPGVRLAHPSNDPDAACMCGDLSAANTICPIRQRR